MLINWHTEIYFYLGQDFIMDLAHLKYFIVFHFFRASLESAETDVDVLEARLERVS